MSSVRNIPINSAEPAPMTIKKKVEAAADTNAPIDEIRHANAPTSQAAQHAAPTGNE